MRDTDTQLSSISYQNAHKGMTVLIIECFYSMQWLICFVFIFEGVIIYCQKMTGGLKI